MDILTRIEEAIMLAVIRLGDDAYGVTIRQEVAEMVGKSYSVGAIYGPLGRLGVNLYPIQKPPVSFVLRQLRPLPSFLTSIQRRVL